MAHCSCYYGHSMWNGDGKPIVWTFRLKFFEQFQQEHPDAVLGSDEYDRIYDCFADGSDEDIDCWYCDECGSIVVFLGDAHIGKCYVPVEVSEPISDMQFECWELYIAMRDWDFEVFSEQSEGKRPLEALVNASNHFRCWVSPEKDRILVLNQGKEFIRLFELK